MFFGHSCLSLPNIDKMNLHQDPLKVQSLPLMTPCIWVRFFSQQELKVGKVAFRKIKLFSFLHFLICINMRKRETLLINKAGMQTKFKHGNISSMNATCVLNHSKFSFPSSPFLDYLYGFFPVISFSTWDGDSIHISTRKEDACEHVKSEIREKSKKVQIIFQTFKFFSLVLF